MSERSRKFSSKTKKIAHDLKKEATHGTSVGARQIKDMLGKTSGRGRKPRQGKHK